MSKAVVNMTDWELYVYNGRYELTGVADNHPSLGKDVYVSYTTTMQKYSFTEDVLTYETKNTIYVCPLKYMRRVPYRNVVEKYKEELTHRADNSENVLDAIIAASACIATGKEKENEFAKHIMKLQELGQKEIEQMKEAKQNRLIEIVKQYEDSVYMEVSKVNSGDLLAYHLGTECGVIEPSLHVGMFQDSVLYLKYPGREEGGCGMDFRYFPRGFEDVMETYSWSDNIKQAVIKNECDYHISFNNIELAPGETKVFTSDSHRQGLISPDCYNGKSTLFSRFVDALEASKADAETESETGAETEES